MVRSYKRVQAGFALWAVTDSCAVLAFKPVYGTIDIIQPNPLLSLVHCPTAPLDHNEVAEAAPFVPLRDPEADAVLLSKLRAWLDKHKHLTCCDDEYRYHEAAYKVLAELANVNARDILAFKETWSQLDTELLLELDGHEDGFVPDSPLTRSAFAERLPRAERFAELVKTPGRVAVVGSGGALRSRRHGPAIDQHAQVVRFNDLIGNNLFAQDTGVKTTMHVSCAKVDTLENDSIIEFDLETGYPWNTYCNRMYSTGIFSNRSVPFLIRPSAYCAMGMGIKGFTRGFVFYWFIGRLFESVDLYGFGGSDHFQKKQGQDVVVHEHYLNFEHLVYKLAMEQQADLAAARQAKAAKKASEKLADKIEARKR